MARGAGAGTLERVPRIVYVSHPQVTIDPETPVHTWSLSDLGRDRVRSMLNHAWLRVIRRVVSSDEVKAIQTAEMVAAELGLDIEVRNGLGEMDRSSTGFLPPTEFERLADAFFARPHESACGWERAVDAQRRVVAGLADLLRSDLDVAVIGHGGVGTLWYCHLADLQISRRWDQKVQGNFFTVDAVSGVPLHPWWPIDRERLVDS